MRTASIADLKNNLSRYLRQVRRGEEVVIRDRHLPIAKIVPLTGEAEIDAETRELVAAGIMRLGTEPMDWDAFRKMPAPRLSLKRVVKAVSDDRDDSDARLLGR